MTLTHEPATALIHHLREAVDHANTLTRQRDQWVERSAATYDEGYARGYADAMTDNKRHAEIIEDWHGKAKGSSELDNSAWPPANGSSVPRGGR
jgi:hypothetical protein